MSPLQLIRNTADLQSTCYFEFLPGEYKKKCWNEGSVFLDEATFGLIEPVIARHVHDFDHYSFVAIRRTSWENVIRDLRDVARKVGSARSVGDLRGVVRFFFDSSEKEFAEDFKANCDALTKLIGELVAWLQETLETQETVSVLGM